VSAGKSPTLTTIRRDAIELPSLVVVAQTPGNAPTQVVLGVDPVSVGTDPDCDLSLGDKRVSRRHCELRLTDRGVLLRDLGSKNGTFVGEIEVVEAILPAEAVATVGSTRLFVRSTGSPSLVPLSASARFGEALGSSVTMRALFAILERAAPTQETILLLGESGTGKELLARGIHAASPRSSGPFVVFDCTSVTPSLAEAELFGYVKGAFTGAAQNRGGLIEEANGGTLFIDEIGELPLELQPKLLRAIEARQIRPVGSADWRRFDARLVAATHRDLRARVAARQFRDDLYYRLAVVEVRVPALRDRKDDIPLLVERFLAAQQPPSALADLPPNALELLLSHDWPGNVRELRNTVARLVLFPHLGKQAIAHAAGAGGEGGIGPLLQLPLSEARALVIDQFEREYVTKKLREQGGNVTRAAESMGVSRQLVHRLMERYGIRSRD
jgi:two-component system, NtrC family, response regulator GlrR